MRLLAEQGYDAMSVEGVAAAAGVGKTTIYRRYPNKRDLVIAALSSVAATLPEPFDAGSTRDDILALIRDTLEVLRRTGVGFSMAGTLLAKERDEPMLLALFRERVLRPRIELGTRILRRGIERGELRPDIEAEVVLPILVGSTFARHIAGFPEDEAWLASMIDTVWKGIAAD
jgi:AcrR family transcriptional regulator